MRYAWDQFDSYFGRERMGSWSPMAKAAMGGLARWDRTTSGRVTRYLAISQHVAKRIALYYNRSSVVVYPPVDTDFFRPASAMDVGTYFLVVSALVPYKRLEVAIGACRRLGAPLKIVGQGPELGRLKRDAGAGVEFLGSCSDEQIRALYRGARAVLLPGEEDFGIVPVEAQACGRPVVALARGGALETVLDGRTGVLVPEATPEAFAEGLERVASLDLDPAVIRDHARSFSRQRFLDEMSDRIEETLRVFRERQAS
jgi:glycosyltransferase involved in cell wall biosynthesis